MGLVLTPGFRETGAECCVLMLLDVQTGGHFFFSATGELKPKQNNFKKMIVPFFFHYLEKLLY